MSERLTGINLENIKNVAVIGLTAASLKGATDAQAQGPYTNEGQFLTPNSTSELGYTTIDQTRGFVIQPIETFKPLKIISNKYKPEESPKPEADKENSLYAPVIFIEVPEQSRESITQALTDHNGVLTIEDTTDSISPVTNPDLYQNLENISLANSFIVANSESLFGVKLDDSDVRTEIHLAEVDGKLYMFAKHVATSNKYVPEGSVFVPAEDGTVRVLTLKNTGSDAVVEIVPVFGKPEGMPVRFIKNQDGIYEPDVFLGWDNSEIPVSQETAGDYSFVLTAYGQALTRAENGNNETPNTSFTTVAGTPEAPQYTLASYTIEQPANLSPEQMIMSIATFPENGIVSNINKTFKSSISQNALNTMEISSMQVSPEVIEQAYQQIINDVYQNAELPVGSELKLKGFNSTNSQEIITGKVENITNYVVTEDEFNSIKSQLQQNNIKFTVSEFQNNERALMFFDGNTTRLIFVTKGVYLNNPNYPKQQVLLSNCFITPYQHITQAAAIGQAKASDYKIDNKSYAAIFGAVTDYNHLFINYQSLSPLTLLALTKRKKRPGFVRGKQIKISR